MARGVWDRRSGRSRTWRNIQRSRDNRGWRQCRLRRSWRRTGCSCARWSGDERLDERRHRCKKSPTSIRRLGRKCAAEHVSGPTMVLRHSKRRGVPNRLSLAPIIGNNLAPLGQALPVHLRCGGGLRDRAELGARLAADGGAVRFHTSPHELTCTRFARETGCRNQSKDYCRSSSPTSFGPSGIKAARSGKAAASLPDRSGSPNSGHAIPISASSQRIERSSEG